MYVGVSSADDLIEQNAEGNRSSAKYSLVIQAIAEDSGISVDETDVAGYFEAQMGTSDYSEYATSYGMPYLKQIALSQKVWDYICDNAVLE